MEPHCHQRNAVWSVQSKQTQPSKAKTGIFTAVLQLDLEDDADLSSQTALLNTDD